MGRGVHRGFITHEELNKSLGKRNLSGENLDQAFIHIFDAKIALVYLGDKDFKIIFENTDRATLASCSRGQYKWLKNEFGGKTLDATLDKMFKPKTKKKSIVPKMPEVKKEVIAEKPKVPEVKKEKVSPIKKKITDSELL